MMLAEEPLHLQKEDINSDITELEPLRPSAASKDSVHKSYDHN